MASQAAAAEIVVMAKNRVAETGVEEQVHVLAVDDSITDRRVIEKLLKISAYKVTVVDSGLKALEILGITDSYGPVKLNVDGDTGSEASNQVKDSTASKEVFSTPSKETFQVNLIITDYCMPGMTGYELLKKIKGSSALKQIPVVVMSSENVPNRIDSCLAEGAEEFLLKPVRLADVKRLRCHIRQSRSNDDNLETSCSKRKASSENLPFESPKSRVRLNNVTVKIT